MSVLGVAYSHWQEKIYVSGIVKTTTWESCIKIRKCLEGTYTDPESGEWLETPNNTNIAIRASFPSIFKLRILVTNCESTALKNVVVTDKIRNNIAPNGTYNVNKGTVFWNPEPHTEGFHKTDFTWNIGTLNGGASALLEIWLETLPNPTGKYEPTSGDEGDGQYLQVNGEVNEETGIIVELGATVYAESDFKILSATTGAIILRIEDDGVEDNRVGAMWIVTKDGLEELPYCTGWSEDR
jgi:hypothetical protein